MVQWIADSPPIHRRKSVRRCVGEVIVGHAGSPPEWACSANAGGAAGAGGFGAFAALCAWAIAVQGVEPGADVLREGGVRRGVRGSRRVGLTGREYEEEGEGEAGELPKKVGGTLRRRESSVRASG